jgi:hypothetical protein
MSSSEGSKKARDKGIDISGLITKALRDMPGETPTYAVIYFIGEGSLGNPNIFVVKITEIFGAGSEIILRRLLSEVETFSATSLFA